ncbi:alpha/beta fold hydrolase [Rhodococcus sp. ARC_M6]|uniref:alpha/beta fold hydrolase n=1 Tax=Rhodococcus sp. ARC_M6 TaxID=2928852 RepID=UPI001FB358B7|nr:alpha/beta hydrolase [Rhodococcus sp. ARC_M6]MCJ0906710.1 alpha/beta hydrolase [Rhodococcus sp. ARC_M6]
MPIARMPDKAEIFYKDWGSGQPVVFSHGWPLTADVWDKQLGLVASSGFRAIAHDRRGHGRSSQTWDGNTMDTWADDLAALIGQLNLRDVILVGHSTGGGEITRYVGRHGTSRVAKMVLVGAVPPLMLLTENNPKGTPRSAFDDIRAGVEADRSQFYLDLSVPFYSGNREGSTLSDGARYAFWLMGMQVGIKAAYDCVKEFSETDFTEDLAKIDVPTFVAVGDDDQIVPIEAAGLRTAELVSGAKLKVYPGGSHGLVDEYEKAFNADLLDFIRN